MASLPGRADTGLVRHTHTRARGAHTPSSQLVATSLVIQGKRPNGPLVGALSPPPTKTSKAWRWGGGTKNSKQLIQAEHEAAG